MLKVTLGILKCNFSSNFQINLKLPNFHFWGGGGGGGGVKVTLLSGWGKLAFFGTLLIVHGQHKVLHSTPRRD